MSNCTICGRPLKDGEICNCSVNEAAAQDYFKISLKKDTLKTMADGVKNFTQMVSEKNDGVYVHAKDGEYENGLGVSGVCVMPAENEVPIRQYNIARLSTPIFKKAYGRLQVTNKRVIFRAAGKSLCGPVVAENEFAVKEIGGIEIKSDYRFSLAVFVLSFIARNILTAVYMALFGYLLKETADKSLAPCVILTVLLTLFSIALMVFVPQKRTFKSASFFSCALSLLTLSGTSFLPLAKMGLSAPSAAKGVLFVAILAIIAYIVSLILLILSGIVEDLRIFVKVNDARGAVEIGRRRFRSERTGFLIVKPWTDTENAIRDLGAMIDDIKNYGDAAIAKWQA